MEDLQHWAALEETAEALKTIRVAVEDLNTDIQGVLLRTRRYRKALEDIFVMEGDDLNPTIHEMRKIARDALFGT